ncbi:MAG: hypothetical protein JWM87_3753 [Candidatus Eremiobacteraeota bacterium]|nr:hypothetical protein [Candidatus Eremiobacteraeota bacterium]
MQPISQSDRINFIRKHLITLPLRCAEPIMFGLHHEEVGEEHAWMRSATVTLLKVRDRRLVVLNEHVIRQIRRAVAKNTTKGTVRVQIGSTPVDIESLLLGTNAASDLAILDATNLTLERGERLDLVNTMTFGATCKPEGFVPLQYHQPSPWPAPDIAADDVVMLGGFPEMMRRRAGVDVTHGTWSMAGIAITGEGFDEFRIRFDRSGWENEFGPSNDPQLLSRELSGLSGSPVFVDRGAEGTLNSPLVGFVKAYQKDDDLLVITSATNIRSDGTLKARPDPIFLADDEGDG